MKEIYMALADYKREMELCMRCSLCKFIPMEKIRGYAHANVCPSIARYNFHAYSGGGRLNLAHALLENRVGKQLDITDKLLEVVYNCQMCGACDVSCKYSMDMDVLDPIQELRAHCVENSRTLPALDSSISNMKKQGTMAPGDPERRGNWAEGLKVKNAAQQKVKVLYQAGCRTCYDKELWKTAQDTVNLLQKAGVDIGILGANETCCGGRAYQMGYKEDFLRQAKQCQALIEKSGAETLVTGCAECYYAFKVLFDKFGLKGKLQVLHTTEYLDQLIKEGKISPTRKLSASVTYHDPCHLGRLGEPYIHWQGKAVPGHIRIFDPPREFQRGAYGVYEPPRRIIKSLPGVQFREMDRIKEYAWCCGAGGGVKETNPEFAGWTAAERIAEAEASGAEILVTACPGCEQSFNQVLKENGSRLKVSDIVELLIQTI
jgi:Fe-S oxidoreductase